MTHEEFIAWIADMERRHPVADWRSEGMRLWPVMRGMLYATNLHARVANRSVGAGGANYARMLFGGMASWARARLTDRRANRSATARAHSAFLAYSVGSQSLVDGRRCNQLLAPYVELLERGGRSATVWEMSPYGDYNTPRFTPSALIQPRLLALRAWSQVKRPRVSGVQLDGHDALVADVARAGLEYPFASRLRLERDVWFIRRLAEIFKVWLERVQPSHGFVADAGPREQAFCLACRELGITSVEIQHGIQGDLHPTYGSWNVVPEDGWDLRPRVYWSWDAGSAAAIERWASRSPAAHRAVVGGDPWISLWLDPSSALARRAADGIARRLDESGGRQHILVTLSYLGEPLPAELREAMRAAPNEWRFWLRLHPVQQADRRAAVVPQLAALGIREEDVAFVTDAPLPALLSTMDVHLSVGSSTVIAQAARLGLRSIACGGEAGSFFATEISSGMARTAASGPDIIEGVRWALAEGRAQPAPLPDPVTGMAEVLATGPAPGRAA